MRTWGQGLVSVSPDGERIEIGTVDGGLVELVMPDVVPAGLLTDDPDEIEHGFRHGAAGLAVRHSLAENWTIRWVLANRGDEPVAVEPLDIDLLLAEEAVGWVWAGGADGLVVVGPDEAPGPVLVIDVRQGMMHREDGSSRLTIVPDGLELGPGQRHVVQWRLRWLASIEAVERPAYLGEENVPVGEVVTIESLDLGVVTPAPVSVNELESKVALGAAGGRHRIQLHSVRGVVSVDACWGSSNAGLLERMTQSLLLEPRLTDAGAYLLTQALLRSATSEPQRVEDIVERFVWYEDPTPLSLATATLMAERNGERNVIGQVVDQLATLPVTLGFGLVVVRTWLAAMTFGLSFDEEAAVQIRRLASVPWARLESSLLHHHGAESSQPVLGGVLTALGGQLPGEPFGLSWTDQAKRVGLLRLWPEEWAPSALVHEVAERSRHRIAAAYDAGLLADPEPLAWLLLAETLG